MDFAYESECVVVSDASNIGEVRRRAVVLASLMGFDELLRAKVAIAATELGRNLHQHAGQGEMVFRRLAPVGLEILALDRGPGMSDVAKCLHDGYSGGGGTPGTGLGAVVRQSSLFDLYSLPGGGTAVLTQFWPKEAAAMFGDEEFVTGAVSLPYPGQEVCGDTWAQSSASRRGIFVLADGLGHGSLAAQAAQHARSTFLEQGAVGSPAELLRRMHAALRPTRGAAAAVACLDNEQGQASFAGIGNISASICTPTGCTGLASANGTLGHEVRSFPEYEYSWPDNGLLIMHSDGLTSRWEMGNYPGLFFKHPGVIAGVLYRDFHRERDDMSVLVVRRQPRGG